MRYLEYCSMFVFRLALMALMAIGCLQLARIAACLNESNHIMVGVENGDVPGNSPAPGQFQHAPAPKEF